MPATDPVLAWTRSKLREGAIAPGPWVPQILPLGLVRLGSFALAILPFEMTTVAGRRLRETIAQALAVESEAPMHVAIATYANAYTGYCTTFEEYQVQHYEAAYTAFGPFQLAATRTVYDRLARRLEHHPGARGPAPVRVPIERLEPIAYRGPWAS
jgi:neutral ceramidase